MYTRLVKIQDVTINGTPVVELCETYSVSEVYDCEDGEEHTRERVRGEETLVPVWTSIGLEGREFVEMCEVVRDKFGYLWLSDEEFEAKLS